MAGRPIELGLTGEAVATNVKRLREAQNLTWTRTAAALTAAGRETSALAVRRVEEGRRRVDADDLAALAVVLNVTPATLLAEETTDSGQRSGVTGYAPSPPARVTWDWLTARAPIHVDPARTAWFTAHAAPPWRLSIDAHPATEAARRLLGAVEEAVEIMATLDAATMENTAAGEAEAIRRRVASRLRREAEQATSQVGYLADDLDATNAAG